MEPLRKRFEQGATEWLIKDYAAFQQRLKIYSDRIAQAASQTELERVVTEFLEGLPGVEKAWLLTQVSPSLGSLLGSQPGPLFLRDSWKASKENGGEEARDCSVLLPLRLHTRLVGAIGIQEKAGHNSYSNRGLEAFTVLANQVAAELVNLRVQEEIQKRKRLTAIGELAAGLAHEIRNPLGAIKGAAQYLRRDLATMESRPVSRLSRLLSKASQPKRDPVRGESQDFLEIILEEVDRLNLVVSQFLDYARPFQKELAWIDLTALIGKGIDRLTASGLYPEVQVTLQAPEGLPLVEVDPEQIKQVLYNLTHNAIQAMPGGGQVVISANVMPEEQMEVVVSDTGIGIPPENLPRLFQPFFTTKEKGTGLGLAICYRIVEGHGGTLSVESEPGRGSRFRIRLPLRQAARRNDDGSLAEQHSGR
ncbi:MAG: hypothetical protein HYY20_03060 [Candidatus Tectomicrobia bacterium]|uniref:histidine kinase n=1 Tax=Tectimicrobiota bacterium TaxID=2528274 RepID=A0A932CM62_UNCTE|nr:hypothetical protein [Candidatus Tectomicrobia bacterium]